MSQILSAVIPSLMTSFTYIDFSSAATDFNSVMNNNTAKIIAYCELYLKLLTTLLHKNASFDLCLQRQIRAAKGLEFLQLYDKHKNGHFVHSYDMM